jgi:uncharacterized iron-regulated membrane protein
MRLRPLLLNTHLVVGLVAAIPLCCLGLTGAILVFENPLNDALNAKMALVTPPPGVAPLSLRALEDTLDRAYPRYRIVEADFGSDDRHAWGIAAVAPDGKGEADLYVDPYSGKTLGRPEQQSQLVGRIHQFHTHFLAGRLGNTITGWSGVVLAFLAISGLILWWPAKILSLRAGATGWRLAFDLHQLIGGISWVLLLALAGSGMVIHWNDQALRLMGTLTGAAPVASPPRSLPECQGKPTLGVDSLIAFARAAVPGAHATVIQVPDDVTRPVRAIFKYPEDRTPAGRTLVYLAACSGRPAQVLSSRTASAAYRWTRMWNREIHTGEVYGWPTRVVVALASLVLPLMALTGPIIWWGRRAAAARPRPGS